MKITGFVLTLLSLLAAPRCMGQAEVAAPLVIPEGGPLEKDHAALRMRWAEAQLLPEAEKRWAGQPWAGQAREVTRAGLALWFSGPDVKGDDARARIRAAETLVEAGCEEPLACLMAHKTLHLLRHDWRGGFHAALRKAMKTVDDPACCGALRAWIEDERADWLKEHNWNMDGHSSKQAARIAAAITDGSYTPEFEPVLVRDFFDWMEDSYISAGTDLDKLREAVEKSPHSEWARGCLLGDLHVQRAWSIRGGAWAREVPQDAWAGFRRQLSIARGHLEKAHALRPERPEAAARMITVVMGQSDKLIERRQWFDRAIAAQFDYPRAYNTLRTALSRRWGGSDDLILAMGRRFAETRRHDTGVTEQFFFSCKQVAVETREPRRVFSSKIVKDMVADFARGVLDHGEKNPVRFARQHGMAAIAAWFAGEDDLAWKALLATDRYLEHSATGMLFHFGHHASTMRNSVFAARGGWGQGLQEIELALRREDTGGALKGLVETPQESLPSDSARRFAEELRASLELPEKLRQGGWHPLPVFPGLSATRCTGGNWRVTKPGEITLTGDDSAHADLAFPLEVGEKVDLRGELVFEMPKESDWFFPWSFGPVLRWQPERFHFPAPGNGLRVLAFHQSRKPPLIRVSGSMFYEIMADTPVEMKPVNTFHLKLAAGSLEHTFNDAVLPPVNVEKIELEDSTGLVGFAGFYIPAGGKVTLRNIEARLRP